MKGLPYFLSSLFLAMSLSLSGCGGDDDGGDDGDGDGGGGDSGELAVTSFAVEGSYEATDGVVPINPAIDDGYFTMEWEVSGFDPQGGVYNFVGYNYYQARARLSEDDTVDEGDITLFWASCGQPQYLCTETGTQTCRFKTNNTIVCEVPRTDQNMTFLADSLDGFDDFLASGLPKSAYILFTACDSLDPTKCSEPKKVAIELQ